MPPPVDPAAVRIGDRFFVRRKEPATVVFSSIDDQWSEEFRKEDWDHIGRGIMFRTDNGALVFLDAAGMDDEPPVPITDPGQTGQVAR